MSLIPRFRAPSGRTRNTTRLALAAEVAVAALFCSTMLVLITRWAIIPTWLLFVVLGNTSSGGAVAQPLLPPR